MNKQEEIKYWIEQRMVAETRTKYAIERIKELAEAEKPKRRHGDFGIKIINEKEHYRRLIVNPANTTGLELYNEYGEVPPDHHAIDIKFGNIFDLMKDWDKDFEGFEIKVYQGGQFNIKIIDGDIQFYLSGHATANLSEAKEIWKQLGHAIISAKRSKYTTDVCSFTN